MSRFTDIMELMETIEHIREDISSKAWFGLGTPEERKKADLKILNLLEGLYETGFHEGFRVGYERAKEYLPVVSSPKSTRQPVENGVVELLPETLQVQEDGDVT
jgi:hypothetical protein